jgi:hypothetical protein
MSESFLESPRNEKRGAASETDAFAKSLSLTAASYPVEEAVWCR